MPGIENRSLVLALLETPGVGWNTLGTILRRLAATGHSASEFLNLSADELMRQYGIRPSGVSQLIVGVRLRLAESEQQDRWMAKNGISLITLLNATYPPALHARLEHPPPTLFIYGNTTIMSGKLIAAANSNGASEDALSAADSAVVTAVESGYAVVTGHNRPAYQRPALAARRNGGRVLYVLDRGLLNGFGGDLSRALFPAARIWGPTFDPACDLAISPFPLRAQGQGANNRRRDSVIFALAGVILAGSLRAGGTMEKECLTAIERGQKVLAHSGAESVAPSGALQVDFRNPDSLGRCLSS